MPPLICDIPRQGEQIDGYIGCGLRFCMGLSELNSALTESDVMDYVGEEIPSGADLDDYTTPGKYYSASGTITGSLSHAPSISYGFTLIVIRTQTSYRRLQLAIDTLGNVIYERGYGDTSWCNWTLMNSAPFIRTFTSSAISVSANSTALSNSISIDSVSGYTPYCVNMYGYGGSGYGYCTIFSISTSSSSVSFGIRNMSSSTDYAPTFRATVLYLPSAS